MIKSKLLRDGSAVVRTDNIVAVYAPTDEKKGRMVLVSEEIYPSVAAAKAAVNSMK